MVKKIDTVIQMIPEGLNICSQSFPGLQFRFKFYFNTHKMTGKTEKKINM